MFKAKRTIEWWIFTSNKSRLPCEDGCDGKSACYVNIWTWVWHSSTKLGKMAQTYDVWGEGRAVCCIFNMANPCGPSSGRVYKGKVEREWETHLMSVSLLHVHGCAHLHTLVLIYLWHTHNLFEKIQINNLLMLSSV